MITLNELFKWQSLLNEQVGLDDKIFARMLTPDPHDKQASIMAGRWIDDLLKGMSSEMEELRNCTYWKHWCSEAQEGRRYEIKDITAARQEVIDMLHFWINLAQVLGMDSEMVGDMYVAKLKKNIQRQDGGYSIEVKDLAWQLVKQYPDVCGIPYPLNAESLEEMEEAAAYYLKWAKEILED